MPLSLSRFPHVVAYLSNLPVGIDSYPECRIRADSHENLRASFPDLARIPELPDVVAAYLAGHYRNEWLPETASNVLLLLARDVVFSSDDQFVDWVRANINKVFDKPIYRVLMYLMSPSLVAVNAAKRWHAFHEGSSLLVRSIEELEGHKIMKAVLTYPPHLFTELLVRQLMAVFESALAASRARNVRLRLLSVTETQAAFEALWQQ